MGLAALVVAQRLSVIVALILLVSFAYNCADAAPSRATDEGSLKAPPEECAEDSSATCSDQRSLAWPDAALISVAVVIASAVVVLTSATAIPHSVIEVGVSVVPIVLVSVILVPLIPVVLIVLVPVVLVLLIPVILVVPVTLGPLIPVVLVVLIPVALIVPILTAKRKDHC